MVADLTTLDCSTLTTRQINAWLREQCSQCSSSDTPSVVLLNPDSRHNLGVGLVHPIRIRFEGPVGYYCAGLCDGVEIEIRGGAGWGLAENLMSGKVVLCGSAGSAAGATMRGGMLIVHGDVGARCAAAMKGGTMLVTGDVGIMTGFMMQKGVLIIAGNAAEALGDSLYEGKIFLRGEADSLGADAQISAITPCDIDFLATVFAKAGVNFSPHEFKKIESARRLYNFDANEKEIWKQAL
jgi:glutamate synthase domain-containing protein 3